MLEIPKLPALPEPEYPNDELDSDDEGPTKVVKPKRNVKPSGPKIADPYDEDQSSSLIPLLIAIAAVVPIIFCLCRL